MLDIENKILAKYNHHTIRVYQAFRSEMADEAIKLGKFGPHFRLNRMSWIKPSFLWMMYRSGWATKKGQERILAIDMKRGGFDFILKNSVLSSYQKDCVVLMKIGNLVSQNQKLDVNGIPIGTFMEIL